MKSFTLRLLAVGALLGCAQATNPIQKVLSLLTDLEAKITKEGEESKAAFEKFTAWCTERSANVGYEIKTGKSEVATLGASIESASSNIASLGAQIEELAGSISGSEADLKAATEIREKETAEFATAEKELMEIISTLERAIGILEREMKKGSSFVQSDLKKAGSFVQALSVMVDASMLSTKDADRLNALVKNSQAEDDSDTDLGAPAGPVYESHGGDIVSTLEGLLDKGEEELKDARQKETTSANNFAMLKQSLEDEIKFGNKDMSAAKKNLAKQQGLKATAEGDLSVTTKDLKEDVANLNTVKNDCMTKSQDYEAESASRAEELKALGEAKKAISENTAGAGENTYGLDQVSAESFLQINRGAASNQAFGLKSGADLANFEAVRFVRELARKQHSEALAQLAARMASAMRIGTEAGADPFGKVKGMIKDMIERLLKDGEADASHKAYCDKEMGETGASKADKTAAKDKLTTEIDSMKARSAQLKEEVAGLQKALSEIASADAESFQMRTDENSMFRKNKAEMEQGLEGVKVALKVLREYYNKEADHDAASGAGQGIIGMLEVVESDLSKGFAEMTVTEETAQAEFEKNKRANDLSKTMKTQDVKYKTKESTQLDKAVNEAASDLEGVQAELDALGEYSGKLKEMCVAKPESYSERAGRRSAEIAGLKQALEILEGEAVLLQKRSVLRGARRHTRLTSQ